MRQPRHGGGTEPLERTGEPSWTVHAADELVADECDVLGRADAWTRRVIGAHHPRLGRVVCPFVPAALERKTFYYAPVRGCRSQADVLLVMADLVEHFVALPPLTGPDAQLKTLVAVFVDIEPAEGEDVVIAAHAELKDRCTQRGLMVGEFAPGYHLPSTRDASVDVGDSPVPVLALRHMLPTDRRFLQDEDSWMVAWATRFGADRVPLFNDFTEEELAAVARVAREKVAEPGETLCQQGDIGHELFLIVDGEAVVRSSGRDVARLGPRDHFGELALLTREHRNATVRAVTNMTLLVLGRREFKEVVDSSPTIAQKLLASLASRLSEAYAASSTRQRA